jgi:ribosomal protein S18 acetylase RimI-like enzyme
VSTGTVVKIASDRAADVAAILLAVSTWSKLKSSFEWRAQDIGVELLTAHSEKGELFGWVENSEILGCMLLVSEDKIHWPDDRPGDALYVHKLAVKRSHAGIGIGEALIAFACRAAKSRGVDVLRLDTVPETRLPAYYERQGFIADPNGPADYAGRWLIRMHKRIE